MAKDKTSGQVVAPKAERYQPAPKQTGDSDSSTTTKLSLLAAVVAVALIIAYLAFAAVQWRSVESEDLAYTRRSQILSGLEALAFAAAGAILGTSVQRRVTEKAEDEARAAKQEAKAQKVRADAEEADAEKGRALENLARAKFATRPSTRVRGPGDAVLADVEDFLRLASQYGAARPGTEG
jgi:hypothetical protein